MADGSCPTAVPTTAERSAPTMVHLATFNASSEYAGQRVLYLHGEPGWHGSDFEIEGSGYVEAIFLIERDAYGQLDWVDQRERERVYNYAQMDPSAAPARYIDGSTPQRPAGVAAASAGAVGAPPGPGEVHGTPIYKRPVFIVFAVLGVFLLCSCCGSAFFWLGV
jgi:hypothetical protein